MNARFPITPDRFRILRKVSHPQKLHAFLSEAADAAVLRKGGWESCEGFWVHPTELGQYTLPQAILCECERVLNPGLKRS